MCYQWMIGGANKCIPLYFSDKPIGQLCCLFGWHRPHPGQNNHMHLNNDLPSGVKFSKQQYGDSMSLLCTCGTLRCQSEAIVHSYAFWPQVPHTTHHFPSATTHFCSSGQVAGANQQKERAVLQRC